MEGYTEIVKLAESALNGDSVKSKFWINKFIEKYPNSKLIKPFKALLIGDKNPDKFRCDGQIIIDENSNCNKPLVSVSLPSQYLQKEWNACKDELELKGNAGEMGTYFAMFMHGWRGRNSEGFWQ